MVTWVDQYPAGDVFITAVTAAELQYGVVRLPDGRRKTVLTVQVAELLAEDFQGQILPFGVNAAAGHARHQGLHRHRCPRARSVGSPGLNGAGWLSCKWVGSGEPLANHKRVVAAVRRIRWASVTVGGWSYSRAVRL